jgi:hypothetical protein
MTSRKAAITLSPACVAELAAPLSTLDEFLRSSPRVAGDLAGFLSSRGARFPGFDACNLIDELSFAALSFRRLAAGPASGDVPGRQEAP